MTKLRTISIKGKAYVAVNDRLKYFREHHAGYSLETEVISVTPEDAFMRAVIRDDTGRILATGVAREVRTDKASFVNATSYVENCETSAWGRALANFGIGIDETVTSADEVANAVNGRIDDTKDADATNDHAVKKPIAEIVKKPIMKKAADDYDATEEQLAEIKQLADDLGITVQKVYDSMTAGLVPNRLQASTVLTALRAKLSKKLDQSAK